VSADDGADDLTAIRARLDAGETCVAEIIEDCLARIRAGNPFWHALLPVDEEAVRREAGQADQRRARGGVTGLLEGLPIVLKDLIEIEGTVSTNGSITRAGCVSTQTAAVVERLRTAGAIIVGKAQMVEFAYGGWGTNHHMGAPRNPCDARVHRSPGGSSSGSGVAVASGMVPASLGSDTGGSIRIPAALQGVTGLKPTVGLVSLHGCLPLSASFDSIGPMARSVAECARITAALAGHDPRDRLSVAVAPHVIPELLAAIGRPADLRGRRVLVCPEASLPVPLAPGVARGLRAVVEVLEALGAQVVWQQAPFDWAELLRRNGQAIGYEVWRQHAAVVRDESLSIDPGVRMRMKRAESITAEDYQAAIAHARRTARALSDWMRGADAWLMPGCPISAPPIEGVDEGDPILSTFTRVANHLGGCALSLPAGVDELGLPVGVQLVGPAFGEAALIAVGHAVQQVTNWHRSKG
jgi:aspartyl-tRNA(Asn)/glutamyl-tRNA(Gln) amidotransferase subunit A